MDIAYFTARVICIVLGLDLNLDIRLGFKFMLDNNVEQDAKLSYSARIKLLNFVYARSTHFPRIIVKEGRRGEESRDARDDMVAKNRDQTRMIIIRVVNTSLEVILF